MSGKFWTVTIFLCMSKTALNIDITKLSLPTSIGWYPNFWYLNVCLKTTKYSRAVKFFQLLHLRPRM